MDAALVFWSAALVDLAAVVGCAVFGVRRIRRGDVRGHRRLMQSAAALVGLFLAAYLLKLRLLGHEDRSLWTRLDHAVLYVHELCVAAMLVGGVLALLRARRFRSQLGEALALPRDGEPLRGGSEHRRAGWIAVVGALTGLATAAAVLAGMYARTG